MAKPKTSVEKVNKIKAMRAEGKSYKHIEKELKICSNTICKVMGTKHSRPLKDDEFFNEPSIKMYTFKAFCDNCSSKTTRKGLPIKNYKNVIKSTIWCPNCNHALYWERIAI